jgi:hypothetical protein
MLILMRIDLVYMLFGRQKGYMPGGMKSPAPPEQNDRDNKRSRYLQRDEQRRKLFGFIRQKGYMSNRL